MIDGLLRDMDRASDEFIPFYLAGLTSRAEDLAFCARQEARITLCYRAEHTAGAVGLIDDVLDDPDHTGEHVPHPGPRRPAARRTGRPHGHQPG